MIYLFHGEDITKSRQKLVALRKKYDSTAITVLTGKVDKSVFMDACEAAPLFADKHLVIVEGTSKELVKLYKDVCDYLDDLPSTTDVAFWSSGKVSARTRLLKDIKDFGKIFNFEEVVKKPFSFLDFLAARSPSSSFAELRKLYDQGESEIGLLHLIAWEMRSLLIAKTCDSNPGLNSYVYNKAKKFSDNFTEDELIDIYNAITDADVSMKLGSEPKLVLDSLVLQITA